MSFDLPPARGQFVEPLAGIDATRLRVYLPANLRAHSHVDAFLVDVIECVAAYAHMGGAAPEGTPGELRDILARVAQSAHGMQHSLAVLADGADACKMLNGQFRYLRHRAREEGRLPTEGRPQVPALPADLPALPELLNRIDADMRLLRTACEYATDQISALRSAPKNRERMLVRWIADAYRRHFGTLPPQRSWFANDFIEYIGGVLRIDLGHRVVGEAVSSLR